MRSECQSRTWPLWILILLCSSGTAHAQHGTSGYASVPMAPASSALLDLQAAGFRLPGRSGVWMATSLRLEYAPIPLLSLSARPVLAAVDYAGDAPVVLGPSDTELAAKARLWSSDAQHADLSAGFSVELPTGDADDGTGNGHVSLFPFAAFSIVAAPELMLHAMAGDRLAIDADEHADHTDEHAGHAAAHGSVIMPHAQHELALHAGACVMLPHFRVSPGLEWMQVLEPNHATLLTGSLEVALLVRDGGQLAAGVDLPMSAQRRFDWRGRVMGAWVW